MYQYLNFIVLSTWLPILLQIFHLLHLVKNGNSYAYKCAPLNFWTCNNIWIICFYISMFLFCLHFLTYIAKDPYLHIHDFRRYIICSPTLPFPRKKTSKCAMFYSSCLSCFLKQILRPVFPWLISVWKLFGYTCIYQVDYFFFNLIFPFTSILGNRVMRWLEIYLLKT